MTTGRRPAGRGERCHIPAASTPGLLQLDMAHGHVSWRRAEHSPQVLRSNQRPTIMAAFQTLLCLADQHIPTTHKMLYAGERTG